MKRTAKISKRKSSAMQRTLGSLNKDACMVWVPSIRHDFAPLNALQHFPQKVGLIQLGLKQPNPNPKPNPNRNPCPNPNPIPIPNPNPAQTLTQPYSQP